MDRRALEKYILDTYGIEPDHPWQDDTDTAVFRHQTNRKWFALAMKIPKEKLGREGGELLIDVVNLKCETALIGSMLMEPGVYRAYHMNKDHWMTIALDGSAADDTILMLLDFSFSLTAPKLKKKSTRRAKMEAS